MESSDPSADLRLSARLVDNVHALLYPLPIMTRVEHVPRRLLLGPLALLMIAIGMLPAACDCDRNPGKAYLCFTPANSSLRVGDSLSLTVTVQPEEDEPRKMDEESGWTWTWKSDDGGEIEFSQSELQWTEQGSHIYLAQVDCTAVTAGTVTIEVGQPSLRSKFVFIGNISCIDSCTITITTW